LKTDVISDVPIRVICLGEILFDYLADQLGESLSQIQSWTTYPGGAPANVAFALSKLGTNTAFLGCIAQDVLGDALLQLLNDQGINIQGLQRIDRFPTRQVYVLRSDSGDREFAAFSGKSPEAFADAHLNSELLPEKLFLEAEYLVIGTLSLAYLDSRQAVFRALELAEKYHLKVVLDVNHRPFFWQDETQAKPLIQKLWQYVDFLKLAKEEALWLFDTSDALAINNSLDSLEGVLVTDGENEVNYCISNQIGRIKPFSVAVKDATGAGDAFLAGFIHQLCRRKLNELNDPQIVKAIVYYACAVGSFTTQSAGAIRAQPTKDELLAFLKTHSNNSYPSQII